MTNVDLGNVVEVLDPLVSPSVYQQGFSVYFVILPTVPYRSVFAAFQPSSFCIHGFVMIFILLTESPRYGSKEFSTLQMLFWFGPTHFDWVVATRHTNTCSCPPVRASSKKDTGWSPRFVSIRTSLCCPSRRQHDLILHWGSYSLSSNRYEWILHKIDFSLF